MPSPLGRHRAPGSEDGECVHLLLEPRDLVGLCPFQAAGAASRRPRRVRLLLRVLPSAEPLLLGTRALRRGRGWPRNCGLCLVLFLRLGPRRRLLAGLGCHGRILAGVRAGRALLGRPDTHGLAGAPQVPVRAPGPSGQARRHQEPGRTGYHRIDAQPRPAQAEARERLPPGVVRGRRAPRLQGLPVPAVGCAPAPRLPAAGHAGHAAAAQLRRSAVVDGGRRAHRSGAWPGGRRRRGDLGRLDAARGAGRAGHR
mmetsp:Transcript_165622/g.531633  ORF Transcript_165622/g.531633 Transcript_165622/m.531633 type:complete len:255 (+) Transcript_165622:589-1353(+)